ncbi:hypothetical protein E0H36_05155 [Rhizobium leguminosarum bv. viciae]|uniref:hypothetical protein n=1 Tax=Rhizobium TaxID=379 RepID=UPI0010317455|nr:MULTISPECIES: hypothetical protein [Rhizobium]TBB53895.1 hypothetical protein ELH44_09530 [Rhizobium ruizarguesonis]TBZ36419.1 hypothetical protein E0H36_05155 [Rhizobium leguminosarum bv. viciae]
MKKESNELACTKDAIIYCRMSSSIQDAESGSENQKQGCRKFAELRGYKVEAVSGGRLGGKQ